MELPVFSVLFVVAYGYYQAGHDASVVQKYWKDTACRVVQLRRSDEHTVFLCDGNAHLHADDGPEAVHASHMRRALRKMGLCSNIGDTRLETYCTTSGEYVQGDYIATSGRIIVDANTMHVPAFAHSAAGGYHEPVLAQLQVTPAPITIAGSRRHAQFDRKPSSSQGSKHRFGRGWQN